MFGSTVLPSNVMPSNQNEDVTTHESGSNVGSIVLKTDVDSNHMVSVNTEVSIVGNK